jgi:hypothetical protein
MWYVRRYHNVVRAAVSQRCHDARLEPPSNLRADGSNSDVLHAKFNGAGLGKIRRQHVLDANQGVVRHSSAERISSKASAGDRDWAMAKM